MFGVRNPRGEYWLIDRFRRILTVFRNDEPDVVVAESGANRADLLPGFELPLGRV